MAVKKQTKLEVEKKILAEKKRFNALVEAKETAATTLKLVTSALTLVAGLAWNEAIKKFAEIYIARWFKDLGELVGLIIYAVVLTIVTVLVIRRLKDVSTKIKPKPVIVVKK